MEKKEYDMNKLANFLTKVQSKLENEGDVFTGNKKILEDWVGELKNDNKCCEKDNLVVEVNNELLEASKNEISSEIDFVLFYIDKIKKSSLSEKQGFLTKLEDVVKNIKSEESIQQIQICLINLLQTDNSEDLVTCILCAGVILPTFKLEFFNSSFLQNYEKLLTHKEYRIKTLMPNITKQILQQDFSHIKEILDICFKDIFRNIDETDHIEGSNCQQQQNEHKISLDTTCLVLLQLLETFKANLKTSEELKALLSNYSKTIIDNLSHKNKGVRIVCYEIIEKIHSILDLFDKRAEIISHINNGLVDFWQQVRFPCLNLLITFYREELSIDKSFIENTLPRICINRYIPVEGIKTIALTLWKTIVKLNGVNILRENFNCFLQLYISELDAKSHIAKEAACRCLQELVMKVLDDTPTNNGILNQEYENIKVKLIECIKDQCWNVREASLNACGYVFIVRNIL
jgi:hypothetical protein